MDNGTKLQSPAKMPKASAPANRTAPKRRRKATSLDKKKARLGWLFVLPFFIGFVVIYLPIMIDSFIYSMSTMVVDRTPGGTGFLLEFVKFKNYQEALFVDPSFVQILTSGIRRLITDIPAIVIFSLFLAVILNQKVMGRAAFRTIFFIPVICATGIMGTIDAANAAYLDYISDHSQGISTGATNAFTIDVDRFLTLFQNMKVGTEISTYVTNAVNGVSSIINRSGVQMLVFLAGLQSISPAIYESCSIDGATTWETFWKITLPMISPMILVNAIYTVIDSFTSESNSVMRYISSMSEQPGKDVVAASMAWIYFGIIILMVLVVFGLLRAFIFYQRRDER